MASFHSELFNTPLAENDWYLSGYITTQQTSMQNYTYFPSTKTPSDGNCTNGLQKITIYVTVGITQHTSNTPPSSCDSQTDQWIWESKIAFVSPSRKPCLVRVFWEKILMLKSRHLKIRRTNKMTTNKTLRSCTAEVLNLLSQEDNRGI